MRTFIVVMLATGCYGGSITDSRDVLADRDLSGIAGPADPNAAQPAERIPRALFGTSNGAPALTFPSLVDSGDAVLFDANDPASPLHFFITPHTAADGVGPLFNQPRCVGCHDNAADNALIAQDLGDTLRTTSPMSRGARTASTEHDQIGPLVATSAFTVFGDFNPADGTFDSLELFGGPVRHRNSAEGCFDDTLPADDHVGPKLRQLGERSAPSYVGRGLIEAIYDGDIEARADADDRVSSTSTLTPSPSCDGDCISGRANLNSPHLAIAGGDPVLRVGRFGLRSAGTTLLEMVAAGAQRDVGFTHPFAPTEEQNPYNAGLMCDLAPDPELTAEEVVALRDLVRNLAPPELDARLLDDDDDDIREGAVLFGVDLDAFRSRLVDGEDPIDPGDEAADHGIAADRQLNCVGCHTPLWLTGHSPAKVGGELLSNRWVPLFSDLLIHDMGHFPPELDAAAIEASHPFFRGISRNLADYALPAQGTATGSEWRTAPLLAFGLVGPPYLHDARVFLNPSAPAYFYYGSRTADEAALPLEARRIEVTDVPSAIRAAIELHDFPQPPDADLDGIPDYASCPPLEPQSDWCSRQSPLRSEARNVMEKWHRLTDVQQSQVVAFLRAL